MSPAADVGASDDSPPFRSDSPIIRAKKHGWLRHAVHALIRHKLKSHFHLILGQGLSELRKQLNECVSGFLFVANHSSWWDFFMAHWLNSSIPIDGYGMTDHSNMIKFRFFQRIGAYSVDRTNPSSIRASIDYTAMLLQKPRSGVWLFPQGKIVSNDVRPLEFQGGLRLLLRRTGRLLIVPTALRFEYWQEEHPVACVRFGTPAYFDSNARFTILDDCCQLLTNELEILKKEMFAQDDTRFEVLLRGKGSTHDQYARIQSTFGGPAHDYSTASDQASAKRLKP